MSRWLAERRRRAGVRRPDGQGGFGLVEVVVSITLFGLAAAGITPLLIGGLRASAATKLETQAKNLGQQRVEVMRNLPFHVARQNGQYLDVLDIYYRDVTPTGALATNDVCTSRTYAAGTYTCRIASLGGQFSRFSQRVDTQFLDANGALVTPPSTYDSQTVDADRPVSNLLGVTVTTSWTQGAKTESATVRTKIANAGGGNVLLRANARIAALTVTSQLASPDGGATQGDQVQLQGGLVSTDGAQSTGSNAGLSVVAALAQTTSGASVRGASLSLNAPPAAAGASPTAGPQTLAGGDCSLACFATTAVSGDQNASVGSGLPKVSTKTSQVNASLRRNGSNYYRGYSFSNAAPSATDPALGLTGAMVSGGTGSTSEVLAGSGYLDATGSGAGAVGSGGTVTVETLQLFPTQLAPGGVVQLSLSASLDCTSGAGSTAVSPTWSGTVSYFSSPDGVSGSYVALPVGAGQPALPDPATLTVAPGVALSTWISAWSALTGPAAVVQSVGRQARGVVPAVVSILTQPTRAGDPTSALNVAAGSLSCLAEDNR